MRMGRTGKQAMVEEGRERHGERYGGIKAAGRRLGVYTGGK